MVILKIFLWAFVQQVMADEKERKKERRKRDFCSGIFQLHEWLGKLRG